MKNLNVNKNSVISRLINNYLLSHKLAILFALIMMIISAGATGLHAWLVQPALDEVLIKGNKAMVKGNINFAPAELMATDLRASVSLILAALTARGKSVINRIYHLDRGYENIEKKLRKVGAKIKRIN